MTRRSRVMQLPLREVFGLAPAPRAKASSKSKSVPTARKPRK